MSYYKKWCMFLSLAVATRVAYSVFFKKKKDAIPKDFNEIIAHSVIVDKVKDKKYTRSKYSRYMVMRSKYSGNKCSRFLIMKRRYRLLYYLSKPRYNLDICTSVLSNITIVKALLKLHYRGVRIRIIVHTDNLVGPVRYRSGLESLAKQGVRIQYIKSTYILRYNFCLTDTLSDDNNVTPYLMTGYLLWTNVAFTCKVADSISVTSEKELVRNAKLQFERLWNLDND